MRWSRESCKTACDFVIHQLVAIPKLDDDADAAAAAGADDDDGGGDDDVDHDDDGDHDHEIDDYDGDHDDDHDDDDDDDDYGNIFSESCKGETHSSCRGPPKTSQK